MVSPKSEIVFRAASSRRKLIIGLGGIGTGWLIWHRFGGSEALWLGSPILILFFAGPLLARPRKVAIFESHFTYWPPFGKAKTFVYSNITSITAGTADVLLPAVAVSRYKAPAVVLQLIDKLEPTTIPLDFENYQEAFDRIMDSWRQTQAIANPQEKIRSRRLARPPASLRWAFEFVRAPR